MLDGRLFRGTHGWGGEIGHLAIRPDGPPCSCGARGCLEQLAGQEAILRAAGLSNRAGTTMAGQPGVDRLVELAESGRPDLLAALDEAGSALGIAVAGVINLIDVGTVVLGGLYAALAPWIAPPVEREIAGRVLAHRWAPVSVTVSGLGGDAAIRGGAGAVVVDGQTYDLTGPEVSKSAAWDAGDALLRAQASAAYGIDPDEFSLVGHN